MLNIMYFQDFSIEISLTIPAVRRRGDFAVSAVFFYKNRKIVTSFRNGILKGKNILLTGLKPMNFSLKQLK